MYPLSEGIPTFTFQPLTQCDLFVKRGLVGLKKPAFVTTRQFLYGSTAGFRTWQRRGEMPKLLELQRCSLMQPEGLVHAVRDSGYQMPKSFSACAVWAPMKCLLKFHRIATFLWHAFLRVHREWYYVLDKQFLHIRDLDVNLRRYSAFAFYYITVWHAEAQYSNCNEMELLRRYCTQKSFRGPLEPHGDTHARTTFLWAGKTPASSAMVRQVTIAVMDEWCGLCQYEVPQRKISLDWLKRTWM